MDSLTSFVLLFLFASQQILLDGGLGGGELGFVGLGLGLSWMREAGMLYCAVLCYAVMRRFGWGEGFGHISFGWLG